MKYIKYKLIMVIMLISYIALFKWVYVTSISPLFFYMGYTYHDLSVMASILSWALPIIPMIWMPLDIQRPSQIIYWLLYLSVVIPSCIIPWYSIDMDYPLQCMLIIVLLLAFGIIGLNYKIPLVRIPRINISWKTFWIIIVFISVVLYFLVISVYGFHIKYIPLTDVYEQRSEYSINALQTSIFVSYAINWLGNVINPLLIIFGLYNKRILLIIGGIIGQLFIYSINGSKLVFLSILFILALFILIKIFKLKRFGITIVSSFIILFLVCIIIDWYSKGIFFSSLFIRRLVVTPGLLTGYYFDFFSINEKVMLSDSIFSKLAQYPYNLPFQNLIGSMYFGTTEASANANIWANAFAHFGYGGQIIFSIFFAAILWVYDSIARDKLILGILIICIYAFIFANTGLFTSLLTGGFLLSIFVTYLIPTDKTLNKFKN